MLNDFLPRFLTSIAQAIKALMAKALTKSGASARQLDLFRDGRLAPEETASSRPTPSRPTPKFRTTQRILHVEPSPETPLDLGGCLPIIWSILAAEYFPDATALKKYEVVWSRRKQIRTLASCSLERQRVVVAKELMAVEHYRWLSPLLYHEMCHAYLGFTLKRQNGRTPWHGPEFRTLEARHPLIPPFNRWVNDGGWATAVRSHRARDAHARRRNQRGNQQAQVSVGK